jgi:hypothetical protein
VWPLDENHEIETCEHVGELRFKGDKINGPRLRGKVANLQLTSIQKLTFGIDCAKNILK